MDCEALFHVAADYRLGAPDPSELYRTNVEGTRSLMAAAVQAGVRKIVYTSSVATMGIPPDGSPGDETSPVSLEAMIGHYKRSKFLAEQVVLQAAADGTPAVIVNPSTPVGPGDVKPTPTGQLVRDAAAGRMPAYVDTGLNIVHVDDVAAGHLLAFHHGRNGERYILGGEDMTLRQILDCIAGIVGGRAPRIRLPYAAVLPMAHVAQIIARLTGRSGRLTLEGRAHVAQTHVLREHQGGSRTRLPVAAAGRGVRGRRRLVSRAGTARLMLLTGEPPGRRFKCSRARRGTRTGRARARAGAGAAEGRKAPCGAHSRRGIGRESCAMSSCRRIPGARSA